jgi:hypothetical protein
MACVVVATTYRCCFQRYFRHHYLMLMVNLMEHFGLDYLEYGFDLEEPHSTGRFVLVKLVHRLVVIVLD